jgi:hypothetical protein
LFHWRLRKAYNLLKVEPIAVSAALTSGTGPSGTCSLSATLSYTDTSSLPLVFEKAAILCIRIGESNNGVRKHGALES